MKAIVITPEMKNFYLNRRNSPKLRTDQILAMISSIDFELFG